MTFLVLDHKVFKNTFIICNNRARTERIFVQLFLATALD